METSNPTSPATEPRSERELLIIPIYKIRKFAKQPRKHFEPEQIHNLSEGLKAHGQEHPISVRRLDPFDGVFEFELINGECRLRASEEAGKTHIEAVIRKPKNFLEQFKMSIIANSNQTPTSALEDIMAAKVLRDEGESVKEIALVFGKTEITIYSYLRLLKLHPNVLGLMGPEIPEEKRLALSTAKLLLDLHHDEQLVMAQMICETGMSAMASKHMIKNMMATKGIKHSGTTPRDDFKLQVARFKRIHELGTMFCDQPLARLDRCLSNRSVDELQTLIDLATEVRDDMSAAIETMERFKIKKPNIRLVV